MFYLIVEPLLKSPQRIVRDWNFLCRSLSISVSFFQFRLCLCSVRLFVYYQSVIFPYLFSAYEFISNHSILVSPSPLWALHHIDLSAVWIECCCENSTCRSLQSTDTISLSVHSYSIQTKTLSLFIRSGNFEMRRRKKATNLNHSTPCWPFQREE